MLDIHQSATERLNYFHDTICENRSTSESAYTENLEMIEITKNFSYLGERLRIVDQKFENHAILHLKICKWFTNLVNNLKTDNIVELENDVHDSMNMCNYVEPSSSRHNEITKQNKVSYAQSIKKVSVVNNEPMIEDKGTENKSSACSDKCMPQLADEDFVETYYENPTSSQEQFSQELTQDAKHTEYEVSERERSMEQASSRSHHDSLDEECINSNLDKEYLEYSYKNDKYALEIDVTDTLSYKSDDVFVPLGDNLMTISDPWVLL